MMWRLQVLKVPKTTALPTDVTLTNQLMGLKESLVGCNEGWSLFIHVMMQTLETNRLMKEAVRAK